MGLCCCTFVSCPAGLCAGSVTAPILGKTQCTTRRTLLRGFLCLFLGGVLFLYLPLTILCARADNEPWLPYKRDGHCWPSWSEEGTETEAYDWGLTAGAAMGFGLAGFLSVLLCYCGNRENGSNNNNNNNRSIDNIEQVHIDEATTTTEASTIIEQVHIDEEGMDGESGGGNDDDEYEIVDI